MNKAPTIVFIRLKNTDNCMKVYYKSKRFTWLWHNEFKNSFIAQVEFWTYETDHDWLLRYPNLSCLLEIQIIKLK